MLEGSSDHHFLADELLSFFEGELEEEQEQAIAEHLEDCDECQERAQQIGRTVVAMKHWTAETHGAAYAAAAQEPARDLAREAIAWLESLSISWLESLSIWLGEVPSPKTPQLGQAAQSEKRPPPPDVLCAHVPTLLGDGQQSEVTDIDVIDPPTLSLQGSLGFTLRIPTAPPTAPQNLALQLLSVDERKPIGEPVEVGPGQECFVTFELPERLRKQWHDIEKQKPESWPFRFALRVLQKGPGSGASGDL